MPNLIFAGLTDLQDLYDLSQIEIPRQLLSLPIECRFIVFDDEGNFVDMVYTIAFGPDVKRLCAKIPSELKEKYS